MEVQFNCFNDCTNNIRILYFKANTHTKDRALKTEVLCNIYYPAKRIFIFNPKYSILKVTIFRRRTADLMAWLYTVNALF